MRLILLHGWTMDGSAFDDLRAALPDIETIAPDLPGHGSAAQLPANLDACADLLDRLLEDGPAAVLGWSMGAATIWRRIARKGVGNIAKLITVDMSPRVLPAPDWPHGIKGSDGDASALIDRVEANWPDVARGIAHTMFAEGPPPVGWEEDRTAAAIAAKPREAMLALWRDLVALDERDVVARIPCSWMVAHGAQSRVYPASAAQWLAETAPHAMIETFQHSGHAPHLEEPETFARRLRQFLELT
ncbi:MAG: alpha/beta fold hydrolase [Silicimonas sp.]|nr:alpha/beta fold hydrolase [Silicimonas sp.]